MINGKNYNRILLSVLLSTDFVAGFLAWSVVFNMQLLNAESGQWVWFLCAEILWITMFLAANLYDTRATLSRFEEILKIIPLVYISLVLFISGHVMNYYVIPVNIKQVLVCGFTFSGFLIIG